MQTYIIATAYFFFIVELLIISRSFFYARRERNARRPDYTPKAAVIAPHYGWDADTEEHTKGLLHQDYAGAYEVFFVTHQNRIRDTMSLIHTSVKLLNHIRMSMCY